MEEAILKIAEAISEIKLSIEALKGSTWSDIITLFAGIITPLGILFGIWKILKDISHQKQLLTEAQNQKEREVITNRLNLFFGPLKGLDFFWILLYSFYRTPIRKL